MSRLSYGYLVPCCEYAQMPPRSLYYTGNGGRIGSF